MLTKRPLREYMCRPDATLRDVLRLINTNSCGIALVLDDQQRLLRAITDGDIRRALLAGAHVDQRVQDLADKMPAREPTVAKASAPPAEMRSLMLRDRIRQLPLTDNEFRVVDLVTLDDLLISEDPPVNAVVMAGGFGTRLRPLTQDTPKPMLPVGDRPLLERIVGQLSAAGISDVSVTTHYMPEVIQQHFGDGSNFGVKMNYVHEQTPLGTAGSLRLLNRPDKPLLVMNGDILTGIDFRQMLDFHQEHKADLTLAVRPYEVLIPYGVVDCEGPRLTNLTEKPTYRYFVNAGIYLLAPEAFDFLGEEGRLDMTQLVDRILESGRNVVSFPVHEYWLDIGQIDDYEQANRDIAQGLLQQPS